MIQRIQSVYLALAVLLLVLSSYQPSLLLLVLSIIGMVALVIALFGYHNRRRQMRLCAVAAVVIVAWILAYVTLLLTHRLALHIVALAPVVALALTLLARRAIKKDDELVRAADRIR